MPESVWEFAAIGTRWRIHSESPLPASARERVLAVIEDYDRTFSRFRSDSLVTAMSWESGQWELPQYAVALFDLYRTLAELTDGAVSPLLGQSLAHLGYGPELSLVPEPGRLPAPAFDDVCRLDGRVLTTSAPIGLDVGAVGKGQLADLVLAALLGHGIGRESGLVVDAGGDIVCAGPTRRLGVEDPTDPGRVLAAVTLADGALCGSSTTRRAWGEGLHHILDARTGSPVRGTLATYSSGPDAITADAATTALFFASPTAVADALGVETFLVHDDGSAAWTVRPRGEVGTAEERTWEVWA